MEVYVSVGFQGDIVSGLRVRIGAHGHNALLGDLHFNFVYAAGNAADAGAVQPGVGFHLVLGLNEKIAAREYLTVQISGGRLFFDRCLEFVSANRGKAYVGK